MHYKATFTSLVYLDYHLSRADTCGDIGTCTYSILATCQIPTNCRWTGRKWITSSSRLVAFSRLLYTWQTYRCLVCGRSVLFSTLISESPSTHTMGTRSKLSGKYVRGAPEYGCLHITPSVGEEWHPRGCLCNGQCWWICQICQSCELCLMWDISDTCVTVILKLICRYKLLKRMR
jgi:hypothetical protein